MEKFNILKDVPAHLPMINVDTDMIIPKQFLKTIKRTGLGKSLFHEMRYSENGEINTEFVLNKQPYNNSSMLIVGKNFGCGSSREHAPWALLDFGIKCLIGPSFADIFYNNCFKNGMLPIILDEKKITEIVQYAERKEKIEVNLTKQEILFGNKKIEFNIDPFKKKCLLNGLDDIAMTLEWLEKISSYESEVKKNLPWLNKND
jgi:3-isopropylmalate/(R)-2-methylmalate dehydratase small subunit